MDVAKKVTGKSKQFVYTEEHFVLPKLISSYFNNLLKTSQDKHYWIITFYIENLDEIKKKLPLNKYQEIEQEYLDQITLKFKQFGGFLYKSKYGLYGAILPIRQSFISDLKCEYNGNLKESRDNEDTLKKYETILASLKKTINIGHESFQIQTKMVVSIYGIHSVDIDELIDCNYLYLKQFIVFDNSLAKNYIQLLNPKYLLKINEQVQTYQKVLNLINQAEFDIELQKIKINNKIYLKPQFFWLKKFTCNLSKILSYFDQKSGCLLQRYLALKAIEKYSLTKKQYQLIVDYPINELNNITFSADKILSKINIFNLTNNDIVLHFSGENFVYDDVFVKNLKSLDTNKIIYILDNEPHLQTKYNFKH